jgi:hypothetical protein
MDEQFEFLRSIVHRLEEASIPYMLTGSLALAIWARPRMTRDIDVVIAARSVAVRWRPSPNAEGIVVRDCQMMLPVQHRRQSDVAS